MGVNAKPHHGRALRRYLSALREDLGAQFGAADTDRIVEEVETHLGVAIDEAGAESEREIAAVLASFGTVTEVGFAYRKSGLHAIGDTDDDTALRGSTSDRNAALHSPDHSSSRPHIMDLLNLGHVFRGFVRKPGFAVVTIATLALGIAANAVILSVVNGVLLQPLPFPDADRLVRVYHDAPGLNLGMDDIGLSFATYFFFKDSSVLEDLAVYQGGAANLSGGEEPQRVGSLGVSHSIFDTLGAPPAMGRAFNVDDEAPGAPPVVILSDELWRTNFGGRSDIIGETVMLDGATVEIVGVMPPGLRFPDSESDLYRPFTLDRNANTLGSLGVDSIGRMPPGMAPEEAGARLAARIENLTEAFPDEPAAPILEEAGLTAYVVDQRENLVGDIEQTLWVLMGSVGFILLIVCANVANVFLVHAEGREREMAIRSAIGASRGRLAAGFLAESAVLGLVSGIVGLALAFAGVRALIRWGPQQLPRIDEIGVDATVIVIVLLVSLATGFLFGIIPTLRFNVKWLGEALKESGRSNTAGRSRFRARNVLVAAQVAFALVLLVGSGLMVRSFASLASIDPGFDPDSMMTFRLALNGNDYPGDAAKAQFIQQTIDLIAEMPGVEAVSAADALPLSPGSSTGTGMSIEGFPLLEGAVPPVHFYKHAAPQYFETMRIPLVSGRTFERTDHEEQRPSVIVNEAFAELYWPGKEAVGKRIQRAGGSTPNPGTWYTIVGVVGNVRQTRLEDDPGAMVYFPLTSFNYTDEDGNRVSPYWEVRNPQFAVRTSGNPTALIQPIRDRIWETDANLPIARAQTMQQHVDDRMAGRSFTMVLLLVGAAGALLIGAVGIYGVISYVVSQQTREIGVRMALGARTEDIGRMVLSRSLSITAIGIVFGVAGAWYLTRFMASLLFGIDPLDPLTFSAVIATLLTVATMAAYLPARRAARVDPLEALRQE